MLVLAWTINRALKARNRNTELDCIFYSLFLTDDVRRLWKSFSCHNILFFILQSVEHWSKHSFHLIRYTKRRVCFFCFTKDHMRHPMRYKVWVESVCSEYCMCWNVYGFDKLWKCFEVAYCVFKEVIFIEKEAINCHC